MPVFVLPWGLKFAFVYPMADAAALLEKTHPPGHMCCSCYAFLRLGFAFPLAQLVSSEGPWTDANRYGTECLCENKAPSLSLVSRRVRRRLLSVPVVFAVVISDERGQNPRVAGLSVPASLFVYMCPPLSCQSRYVSPGRLCSSVRSFSLGVRTLTLCCMFGLRGSGFGPRCLRGRALCVPCLAARACFPSPLAIRVLSSITLKA